METAILIGTVGVLLGALGAVRWTVRRLMAPLEAEAAQLARRAKEASESAEQEARLRRLNDASWTAERLREHARTLTARRKLVVVANREPYRHVWRGTLIACETPASGLVTGVEPVLRACGGVWIAHGDGGADRRMSDAQGRLDVPPGDPQYTLRRLWLTADEEAGYYAGFSNEGLWPLCHIAHQRPSFRPEDWAAYQRVNERFAEAVLEEIDGERDPMVLVQDYHFMLVPRLVKLRRPDALVSIFWHIPWPNAEAFRICPWQGELLEGMLGADLIGFQTRWYCSNFLETVDRALESHIDREGLAVTRRRSTTLVRPFPISVAFPEPSGQSDNAAAKAALLAEHSLDARYVAVGVERMDYTKGLLERFKGLERFFELYPEYRGRLTLFQIAAPSRTGIERYRDAAEAVREEVARLNARFGSRGNPAVVLLERHHDREQLLRYYRAADVCLVTPLHDGMNLVAKEFVAARDDEDGVLILSRFAGAAQELVDALLVNPYDVDGLAEALRVALQMSQEERRLRMFRLRSAVGERNVYRWADSLISTLASVRRGIAAAAAGNGLWKTAKPYPGG